MSFDWIKFVTLAESLPTLNCGCGTEALLRSAISRGYYGLFHVVRKRLLSENAALVFTVDGKVHQDVVQHLVTTIGNVERRKLGTELGRLRQYRNKADYHDELPGVAQIHGLALGTMESVKTLIASQFK